MIQFNDLKAAVADLQGSVSNEIAKRPDFKAIQADVDTMTDSLKALHQALISDASVAGLAAVAQALAVPVAAPSGAVAPVAAPVVSTPVESPVAPVATVPAAPSATAHGPATGIIPEWMKAAASKL